MMLNRWRNASAAVLAIVALVSGHTLQAAAAIARADAQPKGTAYFQITDGDGKVRFRAESVGTFDFGPLVNWSRGFRSDKESLKQWRADVMRLAKLSDRSKARMSRTLAVIDALEAPTPEEYHSRVRALGVTVQTKQITTADGQQGSEKRFIFAGKEVAKMFIPEASQATTADSPSGPSASETPVDCDPSPCATQQEIEDALITVYAAEAELATLESDMTAEYEELEWFCEQNPWACPSEAGAFSSGPSASIDGAPPCFSEWANFAGAVVTGNSVVVLGVAALLAGLAAPVAALVVAGTVLGVAGSLLWGWSGAISLLECKALIVQDVFEVT